MGIFSTVREWLFGAEAPADAQDALLDWCIADALADEAQVPVPAGAWSRLKMTIAERKFVHGYGMWVLDQTFHDPPEKTPAHLSDEQLKRALYLHNSRRSRGRWVVGHPTMGGLSPTFIVVFTL